MNFPQKSLGTRPLSNPSRALSQQRGDHKSNSTSRISNVASSSPLILPLTSISPRVRARIHPNYFNSILLSTVLYRRRKFDTNERICYSSASVRFYCRCSTSRASETPTFRPSFGVRRDEKFSLGSLFERLIAFFSGTSNVSSPNSLG